MTPERARSIVGGIGWLSRQPGAFRKALLEVAELRRVPAGGTIMVLDDPPGTLDCVVDGFVDVLSAPGPFPARLAYLARAGWWFGDVAAVSRTTRRADLTARTDVWLLHLPERRLNHLMAADGENWRRLAELTVAHFDTALQLAGCLAAQDVRQRVAAVICWLSGPNFFSGTVAELPLTHEALGEIAGVSRNTAGRVLADLAGLGLIETGYGRLVIADREGLEALLRA
ncbi:Crp/Fnr family transcriptional regulator [Cribrihabitans sp. XS_ASV171]